MLSLIYPLSLGKFLYFNLFCIELFHTMAHFKVLASIPIGPWFSYESLHKKKLYFIIDYLTVLISALSHLSLARLLVLNGGYLAIGLLAVVACPILLHTVMHLWYVLAWDSIAPIVEQMKSDNNMYQNDKKNEDREANAGVAHDGSKSNNFVGPDNHVHRILSWGASRGWNAKRRSYDHMFHFIITTFDTMVHLLMAAVHLCALNGWL